MMESYTNLYVEDDIECGEHTRISYKQSLLGKDDTNNEHSRNKEEAGNKDMEEENHKFAGLTIVEKKLRKYDCPTLVLSEREEMGIN